MNDLFGFDSELIAAGFSPLAGTDEAGRGPLAGDVFAAAVILRPGTNLPGLNDSKKLSPARREALYGEIISSCDAWAVARGSVQEIAEYNILNASLLAMRRAVDALGVTPELLLIDGNITRGFELPCRSIVGGDGKSACIAAASVLAKVSRDRYMCELDLLYPGYGFAVHKGYGTAAHYAAVSELGLCPVHRVDFFKKRPELLGIKRS